MNKIFLAAALIAAAPAFGQSVRQDSASAAQAIAIAGGGNGTTDGTIRQRVTSVPTVIPPAIQGANPCNTGASGGASWLGFGASAAYLGESRRCRGQEWFRFFMLASQSDPRYAIAAKTIACVTDEDVRETFRLMRDPCPQDVVPAATPAPVVQAAPTQPQTRPDWCFTRDPQVLRRPECRG